MINIVKMTRLEDMLHKKEQRSNVQQYERKRERKRSFVSLTTMSEYDKQHLGKLMSDERLQMKKKNG